MADDEDEAAAVARMVSGLGKRAAPYDEAGRKAVLDSAARLRVRQIEVSELVAAGRPVDAEIIGVGLPAVNDWMGRESAHWREYYSTRGSARVEQLRFSLPVNRIRARGGARIVTLYDFTGLDANARLLVANETLGTYHFGVAPISMTIVEHRFVLLEGPVVDGMMTVMRVSGPATLDAARRYWDAAIRAVVPVDAAFPGLAALTPRQRQVVALLSTDLGDESIAEALEVSVRTVRSDVAAVLTALGVRSRFAAGARLRIWSGLEEA